MSAHKTMSAAKIKSADENMSGIKRMSSKAYDYPLVNLGQHQIESMRIYGTSVALIDAKSGRQYTYNDVINKIQHLAAGLRKLGLRQGDVLCLVLYNNIEYPIIMFAVHFLGGTIQTASPLSTDDDLESRFRQCETKFWVITTDQANRIMNIVYNMNKGSRKTRLHKNIITIDNVKDGFVAYESLFDNDRVTEAADVDPKTAPAINLSSSGTTGLPKDVILTHYNVVANILQTRDTYCHRPGMCAIASLLMSHHYGCIPVNCVGLFNGLKLVVMEHFNITNYLRLIEKHKIEILQPVPPVAIRLVKETTSMRYDTSSVRYIHSGAAPLGPEVEIQLRKRFNTNFVTQTYGLTETGCVVGSRPGEHKIGSTGQITVGTDLKIVNPETQETLPANETGEILVRGPQITIGYVNNMKATHQAFDPEGYFKTGDLGHMDADGNVYVVDRLKELIKYKGFQVAPALLEDILVKHPDISDAAVIGISECHQFDPIKTTGIPDPDAGELPKAFVVRRHSGISEADVCAFVKGKVAPHMRLRGGVEFVTQIPKTPSGKILRRLLRERGWKAKI